MSKARHIAIIRSLPCCIPGCRHTRIELHHIRTAANSGIGMKPSDDWLVPLCFEHHQEGHRRGWRTFERTYDISLSAIARELAQIDTEMP
jgi:hypothetical protein